MPFNHLYILLQLYPDKPWDWSAISDNPNITWEIIQQRPTLPRWNLGIGIGFQGTQTSPGR